MENKGGQQVGPSARPIARGHWARTKQENRDLSEEVERLREENEALKAEVARQRDFHADLSIRELSQWKPLLAAAEGHRCSVQEDGAYRCEICDAIAACGEICLCGHLDRHHDPETGVCRVSNAHCQCQRLRTEESA